MFKQLVSINYNKRLEELAQPFIKQEKYKNNDIYSCINLIIHTEKLLISNINLLLGKEPYLEAVSIYCVNTDIIAKQLIKKLCEVFGQKFVLKILDNNILYSIEYNLQQICNINSLQVYKKYSITEFIQPNKVLINKVSILIIPPLLELINLYKDLYDPSMATSWLEILNTIGKLEVLITSIPELLNTKQNSKELNIILTETTKYKPVHNLHQLLLDFFIDTEYLLLEHTIKSNMLEVISKNDIDFDFKIISNYLSKLVKFGFAYEEKDLHIVKELLMKKFIIYITYNTGIKIEKKRILTIYNNTSYELVNFNHIGQYNIVDPITEIRFIYLNIWNSIINNRIKPNNKFKVKLIQNVVDLENYKKKINVSEFKQNYTGIYTDINIDKKLKALSSINISKPNLYCFDI